ncbi:MAG TPA: AIM24 family protein [Gaiellales bacterium]
MNLPEPVATQPSVQPFRGGTARISGSLVPELVFDLDGSGGIFFEHHTLLWKDAPLTIELKKLPGGIKRKIAGLDFFLTMTRGPGRIAFSHAAPGKIIDHHLEPGQTLLVREHHFLAATDNLEYTFERVKGVRSMLFGGSGFFVDKFSASKGTASVWVMGNGDVYEATLGQGEQIDIEAGSWLYRDPSVRMEAVTMGLKTGLFGGGGKLTWNRFTGPGRVGIQTMFNNPAALVEGVAGSGTAKAAGIGAIIGGLAEGV